MIRGTQCKLLKHSFVGLECQFALNYYCITSRAGQVRVTASANCEGTAWDRSSKLGDAALTDLCVTSVLAFHIEAFFGYVPVASFSCKANARDSFLTKGTQAARVMYLCMQPYQDRLCSGR